jgi:hypothetical protein
MITDFTNSALQGNQIEGGAAAPHSKTCPQFSGSIRGLLLEYAMLGAASASCCCSVRYPERISLRRQAILR